MSELPPRTAELSPERQQLLRRLLNARGRAAPPTSTPTPAAVANVRPAPGVLQRGSTQDLDIKDACRRFYDLVTEQLDASPFGEVSFFLNYGYVPNLNPQCAAVMLPDAMLNKNSVRLVLEVVEDCVSPVTRVLDVGCGRGGTVAVLRQYFGATRVVGLDLSSAAVAFCRRAHAGAGIGFVRGDAESLPFPNGAFDVVTNVESSSCYPDAFSFYAEVHRVLAPRGRFLYTDCLPAERFGEVVQRLQHLGFAIERARDITSNVLASCDQIAAARLGAYGAGNDASAMRDFLGAPGSEYYEKMRAKRWLYQTFKLRKGAAAAAAETPVGMS